MPKKKRKEKKTLLFFLQGVVEEIVEVELRNGDSFKGKVESVDKEMNIVLLLAHKSMSKYEKCEKHETLEFQQLFILGRNIRYIHLPGFDVPETLKLQKQKLERAKNAYKRGAMPQAQNSTQTPDS